MPVTNTTAKISNPKGFISLTRAYNQRAISKYAFEYLISKYYKGQSIQLKLE